MTPNKWSARARRSQAIIRLLAIHLSLCGPAQLFGQEKMDPDHARKKFLQRDQPEQTAIPDLSKLDAEQLRILARQLYQKIEVQAGRINDLNGGAYDQLLQEHRQLIRQNGQLRENAGLTRQDLVMVRRELSDSQRNNQFLTADIQRLKREAERHAIAIDEAEQNAAELRRQLTEAMNHLQSGKEDERRVTNSTPPNTSDIPFGMKGGGLLVPRDDKGQPATDASLNRLWSWVMDRTTRERDFALWKKRFELAQANIDREDLHIEGGLTLFASTKPHLWHALNKEGKQQLLDAIRVWYVEQTYLQATPQRIILVRPSPEPGRISMHTLAASNDWGQMESLE